MSIHIEALNIEAAVHAINQAGIPDPAKQHLERLFREYTAIEIGLISPPDKPFHPLEVVNSYSDPIATVAQAAFAALTMKE